MHTCVICQRERDYVNNLTVEDDGEVYQVKVCHPCWDTVTALATNAVSDDIRAVASRTASNYAELSGRISQLEQRLAERDNLEAEVRELRLTLANTGDF